MVLPSLLLVSTTNIYRTALSETHDVHVPCPGTAKRGGARSHRGAGRVDVVDETDALRCPLCGG